LFKTAGRDSGNPGIGVTAAHLQLAADPPPDRHMGLTLIRVTGEVAELEPYNAPMSKRAEQVQKNLARFEAEWEARHPGREPGLVVAEADGDGVDHDAEQETIDTRQRGSLAQGADALGYTANVPRQHRPPPMSLDELRVQQVASRANAAAWCASTWIAAHRAVEQHVTRIITEAGVRAGRRTPVRRLGSPTACNGRLFVGAAGPARCNPTMLHTSPRCTSSRSRRNCGIR
jgi:hypothetical protein